MSWLIIIAYNYSTIFRRERFNHIVQQQLLFTSREKCKKIRIATQYERLISVKIIRQFLKLRCPMLIIACSIEMKIYNGEEIIEKGRVKKIDISDLREESRGEGMKGISTRFIMKAIDNAMCDSDNDCVTPIGVMSSITKMVKEQIVDEDFREKCLELVRKVVREEYLRILETEIAKAFITAYEEQAQSAISNEHFEKLRELLNSLEPDKRSEAKDYWDKISNNLEFEQSNISNALLSEMLSFVKNNLK